MDNFVPVSVSKDEAERRAALIRRVGVKQYWKDKKRRHLIETNRSADPWFELESSRKKRRSTQLKTERFKMMCDLEKDELGW